MGIAAEQMEAFLRLKEKAPPAEVNVCLDEVPEEAERELGAALSGLTKSFAAFGVALSGSLSEDRIISFRQ
jgi:hypothetical protein